MKLHQSHRPPSSQDLIKSHLVQEHRHDPYKSRGKLPDPTRCTQCGAVFSGGRWQWIDSSPADCHSATCPACRRIADNYPAGEVTLSGTFVSVHSKEILALARNTEAAERSTHPLQRIISVEEGENRIVITTTDIHLPRRLAHALESAYHGEVRTHYDEAGYFVRIAWSRDA